jgi:hypothetical protein
MPLQSPFNFTVEEHDPAEREPFIVHAGTNDIGVARAAFAEVVKQLPGRHVLLPQWRSRVEAKRGRIGRAPEGKGLFEMTAGEITVVFAGTTYRASYAVREGNVHVLTPLGSKPPRPFGNAEPEQVACQMLKEILHERNRRK